MAMTDDPRFTTTKQVEPSFIYRKEVRAAFYQVALVVFLVAFFWMLISNTLTNLRSKGIASGFDFLGSVASFDISQVWLNYTSTSSYGLAFIVGIINTMVVAVIGVVAATVIGFTAGIARLSKNWLVARIAALYVEIVRNLPLLLQLFFWYGVVLAALPGPRQSYSFAQSAFLNNRGLILPRPQFLDGSGLLIASFFVALFVAIGVSIWGSRRQLETGVRPPVLVINIAALIGLPVVTYFITGRPLNFEYPALQGFNFVGGLTLIPEYMALTLGLSVYTGAFIAEIVRAGIAGVPRGQTEAGTAIGLTTGQNLRLVVVPQAARIIIPPLTSQYLNLTKNSSLAVAIGYQDLFSVGGTINNQTGQAVEAVLMIMAVYLALSLLTAAFMNWFNARMALVER